MGQAQITLPVAERDHIVAARLHLVYTHSISLIKHRSLLAVRLNDQTVAQLPLDPQSPEMAADILLPVGQLKPGYNPLSFVAAQHAVDLACENPDAPELWTEIDTHRSTITLQTAPSSHVLQLSDLEHLFDPKRGQKAALALLIADPHDRTQLAWGASVVSSAATRYRYKPLQVSIAPPQVSDAPGQFLGVDIEMLAGKDVVAVGTTQQLAPWLDKRSRLFITGPFLALRPLDRARGSYALLVSGRDSKEVEVALHALSQINFALPQATETLIQKTDAQTPVWRPADLLGGSFTFSSLGVNTGALAGGTDVRRLVINLPSDWTAADNDQVHLALDFGLTAGLRSDSELEILVNDVQIRSIALNDITGGNVRGYGVDFPIRSLKAGRNEITFVSHLYPATKLDCTVDPRANFMLTLYGSSSITLPDLPRFTRMPELSQFARTGFPHVDDKVTQIRLVSQETQTLAAAMSLVAKLTQVRGAQLSGTQWHLDDDPVSGHEIVLGVAPAIAARHSEALPLTLGDHGIASFSTDKPATQRHWLPQWAADRLYAWYQPDLVETHRIEMELAPGTVSYATQYKNAQGFTITELTAGDGDTLGNGIAHLLEPSVWSSLSGDVAIWQPDSPQVMQQHSDAEYFVGDISPWVWLNLQLTRNPLLWFAVCVVALVLSAWFTRYLLLRFKAKHHAPDVTEAME